MTVLDALKDVLASTLVMWGDRDTYTARDQQDRLTAAIPGARLLVYHGGGHAFQWEDPAGVAQDLVSFLSSQSAATGTPQPEARPSRAV